MTGVELFYAFIGWRGIIWDRGGNFSKYIDRGSHQGTHLIGALGQGVSKQVRIESRLATVAHNN